MCVLLQARRRIVRHFKYSGDDTRHAGPDFGWTSHAKRQPFTCLVCIFNTSWLNIILLYKGCLWLIRAHHVESVLGGYPASFVVHISYKLIMVAGSPP